MIRSPRLIAALCVLMTAVPARAQLTDAQLAADVDAFTKQLVTLSGLPGVAVTVVRNDRPILVKGYGFSDIERKIPVTENTAFYIASTTKAFTALTLALMADRKVVDLDAPITRYLKDAKWGPGVNPDSITLRRLLSHSHGIENSGPVVWRTAFTGVHTNAQLKDMLQYHKASDAGRNYRYTNLGYNIAGIIIDDMTKGKWQDAIEKNVTGPLGMKHTTAYISRFDSAQLAMPYTYEPTGPRRAYFAKKDANMQAAGGLVSTAADMAKWLEVQINQGKLDGKQVFPQHVMAETQKRQVSASQKMGDAQLIGYSLGWQMMTLGADTVFVHGGGFSAFRTMIAFSPKHRVGVAIMANEGNFGGGFGEVISTYALERAIYPEATQTKYAERMPRMPELIARMKSGIEQDRARRAARPQTLSKPMEAYTGTFEHPQGGEMTWTLRDGRLWAEIGVLKSIVEVYDAETDKVRLELEPGQGEVIQFKFTDGRASSLVYNGREFVRK